MNGSNILSITAPELLFSKGDVVTIEKEYKSLARTHHPDVSGEVNAHDIFAHIGKLRAEAIEKAERGVWEIPGICTFKDSYGREYRIKYQYRFYSAFGRAYVSGTVVAFFIDKQYKNQYTNAKRRIKNLSFSSDRMRKEFSRYLPHIKYEGQTEDAYVLILNKTVDVVPLRGIKLLYGGSVDPKHVAWIMSSLHNMLCYLNWSQIVHTDINLDTYFVSYKHHTGVLLGGWWYSTDTDADLKIVSKHTYNNMSPILRRDKVATTAIDVGLIRSIGRELMGDFLSKKKHPELAPMIDWMLLTNRATPIEQFQQWGEVLTETFGKRKFIKMKATNKEIYSLLNSQ